MSDILSALPPPKETLCEPLGVRLKFSTRAALQRLAQRRGEPESSAARAVLEAAMEAAARGVDVTETRTSG